MGALILKLVGILALPAVAFVLGGKLLFASTHRGEVAAQVAAHAMPGRPAERKPLNQRLGGYDRDAVARYWGALDGERRADERRFLQLDLGFPFVYAGAMAVSLLLAWALAGRPGNAAWAVAPALLLALSDWTENLVQLAQLERFDKAGAGGGAAALEVGWIRVASFATQCKLALISISAVVLLGLAAAAVRAFRAA